MDCAFGEQKQERRTEKEAQEVALRQEEAQGASVLEVKQDGQQCFVQGMEAWRSWREDFRVQG